MKASWRCLEDVLKKSWRRIVKANILVLTRIAKTNILVLTKTSWRRLEDVIWRRKARANIFVLVKTSWRRLEDVLWRRRRKTSSRRLYQDECLLGRTMCHTTLSSSRSIITLPFEVNCRPARSWNYIFLKHETWNWKLK